MKVGAAVAARTTQRWIPLFFCLVACGGSSRPGRSTTLVSASTSVDETLSRAERSIAEGELERANGLLVSVQSLRPTEPLSHLATLRIARLRLARNDLTGAQTELDAVPRGVDPALDLRRALLQGLLHARRDEPDAGIALLRPLEGRMIDREDNVEAACGVLALEARARGGSVARALRAVAVVETAAEGGARWLPTGLSCDDPAQRSATLRGLLPRVDNPRALADTLDVLPAGHSLRVEIARRLRAVAESLHEVPRWLHWMADLRDDEATLLPIDVGEDRATLRIGVLAPLAGPLASIGTEIVRAVQIAAEGTAAVDVVAVDEGDTPERAMAGLDQLVSQRVHVVIGPTVERHARAVSLRAESSAVTLYLPVPYVDAVPSPNGHTILAGPSASERASTLAAAARRQGVRAVLLTGEGTGASEFAQRLRHLLQLAGVTALERGVDGDPRVVTGSQGHEARERANSLAARSPSRWVFDGRSVRAGGFGVVVGLRSGPDFESVHRRFCGLTGRAPGELALLAYDAALTAIAADRGVPAARALATPWALEVVTVRDARGSERLAVTRSCASEVLPPSQSGDPYAPEVGTPTAVPERAQ